LQKVDKVSKVEIIAPATVANLNVGFDSLGLALNSPTERMILRVVEENGVRLILEPNSELPSEAELNVAGKAAISALNMLDKPFGVEIEIYKSIMPGSGIGSSAASAVAAVVGVCELAKLVGKDLSETDRLEAALDGEQIASGFRHSDNIAPALLGGLCLIDPDGVPRKLPVPDGLHIVVLHPQVEIKTSESRAVLPSKVLLRDAIHASAWMGRFVQSCYTNDLEGFSYSLKDLLVGPYRKPLLPAFDKCEKAAKNAGTLGGGISGSGPSSFWIANSKENAVSIAKALEEVMLNESIEYNVHVTTVSNTGAHAV
jgi:homoserine kinase